MATMAAASAPRTRPAGPVRLPSYCSRDAARAGNPKARTTEMGKKVEQENLPSVVMPSCEMRKILAGQKALATGANSGIGKAIAIALGQAGADVVVNYVTNPGQAEEVVAKIRQSGVKAYAHQADVSQEDQVKTMFARMCAEFGTIDIMVNTAAWSTAEAYASLMELVPYKRIGEPEDIGRVVAWLASDEADYITGASIFVDGGMILYPGFATGG